MKTLLVILFFGIAAAAHAQTIPVQSGAHEGFSRLVLTFPKLGDWSLTREDDGYNLSIAGANPTYDLSDVFRRIEPDRLSSISVEPGGGGLKLTVGCACYAMPYELEKGLLVIDIKDGAPPQGSSFELSSKGDLLPPLGAPPLGRPEPRPVALPTSTAILADTITSAPPTLSTAITEAARLPLELDMLDVIEAAPSLDQAKQDLLWQLSKGAAAGVVEIAKSFEPIVPSKQPGSSQSNLRIGADLGLVPNTIKRPTDQMTGAGDHCIQDAQLDIGSWATEGDVISGIALGTTSLVGEFDRPDPDAITRAVRYYLSLGFGAEARLILGAFKISPPDRAIWETLSHIIDLEVPPGDVFANMEVCDSNVALWSILSIKEIPPPNQIAIPAVLRSFSSLPLHLRRLLGPDLASRFLLRNDTATARAIRDAILRAPGNSGEAVQMLEAEIALAHGDTALAEEILSPLAGGSGPLGLRSTAALIQTQVDSGEAVTSDLTTTAESLLQEARGGEEEGLLTAALALAYASQNRFEDAFTLFAPNDPESFPIWEVLADLGNDESIMRWALFQKSEMPPALNPGLTVKIARHLLDLGFPEQALIWLNAKARDHAQDGESARLLAAQAEFSLGNLPKALSHLDGVQSDDATRLRGTVLAGMRADEAVDYLSQTGQPAEAASLAKKTRDWSGLSNLDQGGIWQDATALLQPILEATAPAAPTAQTSGADVADLGPLAQTRATLDESAAAREILDKLLAEQSM